MQTKNKSLHIIFRVIFVIFAISLMALAFLALFRGYQIACIAGVSAVVLLCFLISNHNVKANIAKIFDIEIK